MFEKCPVCNIKVVPTADGSCPSCRQHLFPSVPGAAVEKHFDAKPLNPRPAKMLPDREHELLVEDLLWSLAGRMRLLGIVVLLLAPSAALVTFCFNAWASVALLLASVSGLLLIQTGQAFREYAESLRREDWRVALQSLDRLMTYQFVILVAATLPMFYLVWVVFSTALSR